MPPLRRSSLIIRTTIRTFGTFAILAVVLAASFAQAEIKPHALFSDHVVLRKGSNIPVWGKTDSNEKVSVTLAGQTVSAVPSDGKWRVDLVDLKIGGPHEMLIEQADVTLTIKDVLIGEVWLCGGQSNM